MPTLKRALENAVEELNNRDTFKDLGVSLRRGGFTRERNALELKLHHDFGKARALEIYSLMAQLKPTLQEIFVSHLAQHDPTFAGAKLELKRRFLTTRNGRMGAARPDGEVVIRITKPGLIRPKAM